MAEGQPITFDKYVMAATNILSEPKYPNTDGFNGRPNETCEKLAARVPKSGTFQSNFRGFQEDGQIIFATEKVSRTKT